MGQWIGVVIKLVDIKGVWCFIGKVVGIILVVGWVVFIDVGVGEQYCCVQCLQVKDFFVVYFVWYYQDQVVIFLCCNQCQIEVGIVGGGFDNCFFGCQFFLVFGFINY